MAVDVPAKPDVDVKARHFIDGEFIGPRAGKSFTDLNPATGEELCQVPLGGEEEIDRAVKAARQEFEEGWGQTDPKHRAEVIHALADLIDEYAEELAYLETLDTGKPHHVARNVDIPRAPQNLRFFADFIKSDHTEAYEMIEEDGLNYSLQRPVGVAGMIVPWNLPLLLLTWKVGPALAAGDTIVAKPAEQTPLTATKLAEIIQESPLPDGVFNLVHGYGPDSAGEALSSHPDVDVISFTGENETGKVIMAQAADSLKKVSFEMGGRNPLLVFEDADMDELIQNTCKSNFVNQGEVCLAPDRIYVERSVYDEFVERFSEAAADLKTGHPFDEDTYVGALISEDHYNKVSFYIEQAREEGANILTGGGSPDDLPPELSGGHYIEPTVITGLDNDSPVVQEEIFGPVSCVLPFDTEEEALHKANDTRFGLSATLWTDDLSRAHRVAAELEAGIIWVNTWFLRDLRTPFGGMKDSGIGREGGHYSFEFYSEVKNVSIQL